jgi:hypothetical protein
MALMFKNPSSSFKPLSLWKIWGLRVLVVFYAAAGCCAAIGRHCGRYPAFLPGGRGPNAICEETLLP